MTDAVRASVAGAVGLSSGVALLRIWFTRHPDHEQSLVHVWGVLLVPVVVAWQLWLVLDLPEAYLLAAYVGLAVAPAVELAGSRDV